MTDGVVHDQGCLQRPALMLPQSRRCDKLQLSPPNPTLPDSHTPSHTSRRTLPALSSSSIMRVTTWSMSWYVRVVHSSKCSLAWARCWWYLERMQQYNAQQEKAPSAPNSLTRPAQHALIGLTHVDRLEAWASASPACLASSKPRHNSFDWLSSQRLSLLCLCYWLAELPPACNPAACL